MTGETRREFCKFCQRLVWVVKRAHEWVCSDCGHVV